MRRVAFIALVAIAAMTRSHAADAGGLAVAAQYRTEERVRGDEPRTHEWRLWRTDDQVVRQQLPQGEIEEWQRDGGVLLHRRLYPELRRGIEFQPADLAMMNVQPSWDDVAEVLPRGVLEQLACGATKERAGVPLRTCRGTLDGVRWTVRLRTDLQLPVSAERIDRRGRIRLTLLEAQPLAAAAWPRPDAAGYDVMDFADLGDHEHDPFARRIEALVGIGHGHAP